MFLLFYVAPYRHHSQSRSDDACCHLFVITHGNTVPPGLECNELLRERAIRSGARVSAHTRAGVVHAGAQRLVVLQ